MVHKKAFKESPMRIYQYSDSINNLKPQHIGEILVGTRLITKKSFANLVLREIYILSIVYE